MLFRSLAAQQRQAAPGTTPGAATPSSTFSCDRNALTVYTGVVTRYRRSVGQTTLRIRTDEHTTENITLKHPGTDDASALFRLRGASFTASDWNAIELKKGTLRPGTRASAWVCADGQVMVDWGVQPDVR